MKESPNGLVRRFHFFVLNLVWIGMGLAIPPIVNATEAANLLSPFETFKALDHLRQATQNTRMDEGVRAIIHDPAIHSLVPSQTISGPGNIETTKFQHYYKGKEVLGSMVFHHLSPRGFFIRNQLARFDLDTTPTITPETATSLARGLSGDLLLNKEPRLMILPSRTPGSARLIYWIELNGKGTEGVQDILIDAHSGRLIAELSHNYTLAPVQVYSAHKMGVKIIPNITGDGVTESRKIKNCEFINLDTGTSHIVSSPVCVEIFQGKSNLIANACQVLAGGDGMPMDISARSCRPVVTDNKILDQRDPSVLRAAQNSTEVLNYFQSHFNRNSYDNNGSELISVIHAGEKMGNAFWMSDLDTMAYGDGDGVQMGDLTAALDVAGHEMTHGVTSHTAKLLMMNESGALNEAFSDFFGKLIENKKDWIIGRTLFQGPNAPKGIRDLADPESISDSILDRDGNAIDKPYPASKAQAATVGTDEPCNSSNDRCWVHFNSTIPSHASYLVYQSIGAAKAELLYYTVLTQNLSPNDTFTSAAKAIVETCGHLGFLTSDCEAVKSAYTQAGILD